MKSNFEWNEVLESEISKNRLKFIPDINFSQQSFSATFHKNIPKVDIEEWVDRHARPVALNTKVAMTSAKLGLKQDSNNPNISDSFYSYNLWARISKNPKEDPAYNPYHCVPPNFYQEWDDKTEKRIDELHKGVGSAFKNENKQKYGTSMDN
eukprot:CAMPEP_0116893974 /NCGR_PEP_ID=MMETSP0467-20121206/3859_1 /TAXON_ID=283647 /ORGANISM="Mesodinium pulex, Strain SPMC105" /LENGTH=151 /DNA_ID=CAMNT_0004563963 /DNA_START=621 /DNA_END=1076 /DNA_ORIENTATION=+